MASDERIKNEPSVSLVERASAILASKYPTFRREEQLSQGGRGDATFVGQFRRTTGLWLVEAHDSIKAATRKAFPGTIKLHIDHFVGVRFAGVLIIVPEYSSKDRAKILSAIGSEITVAHVELVTPFELELASPFDLYAEYPGEVANIGHNSQQFADTIEALDDFSQRLASSNTSGLTADVKDRLLKEVEAGRTLLNASSVRVVALAHTLVPALKFVAENCARVTVGELAKTALLHLIKLIFG